MAKEIKLKEKSGMLLPAIAAVDHAGLDHAHGSAVSINRDRVRDRIWPSAIFVEVNERTDAPFFAEPISGIVVIDRVQADALDRDIRIYGFKFTQGDNSTDTVMSPGIQELGMQGQVNADLSIVGAEHIQNISKIEGFLIAVPFPVRIRI